MRRWVWLLGAFVLMAGLPLFAQSTEGAHWRLGHFAVDVTEVDVYLDNTILLQQVKLATLSAWRDLPSGAHTITITPTGGALDRPLLLPFTLNAQAGGWVTLALAGRRTDGSLKLHAVVEDMRPIARGLTRLSVFNAFPNNPPLTIRLGEQEIIRRLAYPGTLPDGNDGLESRDVVAGSYALTVELSDGRAVIDLPNVGLGAERAYLLVIFGTLDRPFPLLVATDLNASGTPFVPTAGGVPVIVPTATSLPNTPIVVVPTRAAATQAAAESQSTSAANAQETAEPQPTSSSAVPTVTLALSAPTGGMAQVRFGHFAPGTPGMTVYLDSQIVAELNSKGTVITAYQDIATGTHVLSLVLEGETLDQAFLRQNVTFQGGHYLVAAIGSLDTGTFGIVAAQENITPKEGETQIGLFNAIPDVKEIALLDEQGVPIFEKVAFPLAYEDAGTGYASAGVLPGRYRFVVAEDLGNEQYEPLRTLPEVRLGVGRYYTLVITGLRDQPNQPYLIFSSYPPSIAVTVVPDASTATPVSP